MKNIQTLRNDMTLTQEAEIKFKRYKGVNDDDDSSVMQVIAFPHSEVMTVQDKMVCTQTLKVVTRYMK